MKQKVKVMPVNPVSVEAGFEENTEEMNLVLSLERRTDLRILDVGFTQDGAREVVCSMLGALAEIGDEIAQQAVCFIHELNEAADDDEDDDDD